MKARKRDLIDSSRPLIVAKLEAARTEAEAARYRTLLDRVDQFADVEGSASVPLIRCPHCHMPIDPLPSKCEECAEIVPIGLRLDETGLWKIYATTMLILLAFAAAGVLAGLLVNQPVVRLCGWTLAVVASVFALPHIIKTTLWLKWVIPNRLRR